ncbi:hypothetical protein PP417_19925 [Mycobacteroides abscessus]|nr:hypothetical protein [Mycobacteroides abscessus]
MKLEPTEVQRKAMAVELKAFGGWTLETCHKAIDALIAAANSIPEGMPAPTPRPRDVACSGYRGYSTTFLEMAA